MQVPHSRYEGSPNRLLPWPKSTCSQSIQLSEGAEKRSVPFGALKDNTKSSLLRECLSHYETRQAEEFPVTSQAIAHIKPLNSRATAVHASTGRFPLLTRYQYLLQSRFCAFHAIVCTVSVVFSARRW